MALVSVSTTAALVSALKTAKNGDTISLASGTYSAVNLNNINIAGNVTITSANPGRPAVVTDMNVKNSSGLTFSRLDLAADFSKGDNPYKISGSTDIKLDRLDVHGSVNGVTDDKALMLVRDSADVSVTNSQFHDATIGFGFLDSSKLTVTGNSFHDIRMDGIRGGGSSDLVFTGNSFTDFYPAPGDHPDAIQLWSTNAKESASNILIADNVVTRGNGAPIQGIFIRDTYDTMPFKNVTIRNNTLLGAGINGISVDGAIGVTVEDNLVAAIDGSNSAIRIEKAVDAKVLRNQASNYTYIESPDAKRVDNVKLGTVSAADTAAIDRLVDTFTGLPAALGAAVGRTLARLVNKQGFAEDQRVTAAAAAEHVFAEQVVVGTAGADRLVVKGVGDFRLEGGDGNDSLTGGGTGYAYLIGGKGDDIYVVKNTQDHVVEKAGEGYDTVTTHIDYTLGDNVEMLRMAVGGLTGRGNALDNRIVGSSGDDRLYGEGGNDMIQGGAGNDRIWGGDGNDDLRGEDGDDFIYGGAGDDKLIGGAGKDVLEGGAGTNVLEGGAGADRLVGGSGQDTFVYRNGDFDLGVAASMDTIVGFSSAHKDKISLSAVDANTRTAVDDKFVFIGTEGFHKVAGELRIEKMGADLRVMGDVNGDGVADFMIQVLGVHTLTAADFAL